MLFSAFLASIAGNSWPEWRDNEVNAIGKAMKAGILRADPSYLDLLNSFALRDTAIALGYYLLILVVYYILGWVKATSGEYYGVPASIALMLIPVLICRRTSALGLSKRNLKPSLIVSGIIGILFLLVTTVIPGILSHAKLLPLKEFAANIFYFFIIIGLSEEISFRGNIQPRLFPLVKREWLAILLGGVLFVFMHYPYQMAARNMSFTGYWPHFIANVPFQFLWHLVFTGLYRRYVYYTKHYKRG